MQRNGYRHGLREPAVQVRFGFLRPTTVDLRAVDALLDACLGVTPEPFPDAGRPTPAAALAWRILLTGRALRQAGRLPVFAPGRLLRVDAPPGASRRVDVRAAVPGPDGVSDAAHAETYRAATALVMHAARPGCTPEDLEPLCAQVEAGVISPLRALSAGGISTLPILRAAWERDIPFRRLVSGVYQLGWGSRARTVDRSAVDVDSAIGSAISGRKDVTAELLRAAGLPVPEHLRVASEEQAQQAAARLGWPVVVKPADRDRSEGVTVDVGTPAALGAAYRHAASRSKHVLIERQVPGICYRLLVANGALLYAISREPVAVTGDGTRSVAELLEARAAADRRRAVWRRSKPITLDVETRAALTRQGLDGTSRPEAGRKVALRAIESSEWGGEIADVTDRVHPDNAAIAVRAARLMGLSNAGVDLLSPDIARPWHENGAVLNELNFAPYFGGNAFAQARLPRFLGGLVTDDGRIPVEVWVGGGGALARAVERQRTLAAAGQDAHLTTHAETLGPGGAAMPLAATGAFDRTLALLADRETRHLIVVLQTDEWTRTGAPVDRITRFEVCDDPDGPNPRATAALAADLRLLLGPEVSRGPI